MRDDLAINSDTIAITLQEACNTLLSPLAERAQEAAVLAAEQTRGRISGGLPMLYLLTLLAHTLHLLARPPLYRVQSVTARARFSLRRLLERLERVYGVKLPESVVEAYVDWELDLLFVRFKKPSGPEVGEPLPTKALATLFTEEGTGEITALEVVGLSELLKELEGPRAELPSNRELVAMIMYLAGGRVRGSTRLQKTVFLVQRRLGLGGLRFESRRYGPWSRELEELLRELEGRGLLKVRAETPDLASEFFGESPSRVYEASRELIEEGERAYARLAETEPLKALQLKRLVAAALAAPLSYLVAYVYAKYPEMTARSSIHDKVREWMRFYVR